MNNYCFFRVAAAEHLGCIKSAVQKKVGPHQEEHTNATRSGAAFGQLLRCLLGGLFVSGVLQVWIWSLTT